MLTSVLCLVDTSEPLVMLSSWVLVVPENFLDPCSSFLFPQLIYFLMFSDTFRLVMPFEMVTRQRLRNPAEWPEIWTTQHWESDLQSSSLPSSLLWSRLRLLIINFKGMLIHFLAETMIKIHMKKKFWKYFRF